VSRFLNNVCRRYRVIAPVKQMNASEARRNLVSKAASDPMGGRSDPFQGYDDQLLVPLPGGGAKLCLGVPQNVHFV
jgi:hypothetical protein